MGSNGFFRISLRFHHVPPGAVITTICDLCTVLLMSAAMLLDTSRTPVLSTLSNHARDCVIIKSLFDLNLAYLAPHPKVAWVVSYSCMGQAQVEVHMVAIGRSNNLGHLFDAHLGIHHLFGI